MQRSTIQPNVLNVTHEDRYGKIKNFYRFIFCPIYPDMKYAFSLQSHALSFRDVTTHYEKLPNFKEVKVETKNYFHIQAMIANNYQKMVTLFNARHQSLSNDVNFLVIDIEKEIFGERAIILPPLPNSAWDPANLKPKISSVTINRSSGINAEFDHDLAYPIYNRMLTMYVQPRDSDLTYRMPYKLKNNSRDIPQPIEEINEEGKEIYPIAIFDYGKDKEGNELGEDILLDISVDAFTASYQRKITHKTSTFIDWCSNMQKEMNKEAYLVLTEQLEEKKGNAEKIARLFDDYEKKSKGFSGLIHFHLFRHAENIQKAQIIAKDLISENFKNASNMQVAEYLAIKFEGLKVELAKSKKTINPEGSFARRINYSILQLTNGMCHSVADFRAYQALSPEQQKPTFLFKNVFIRN